MASNFVWYELMTTDVSAAVRFYEHVVGWNSEAFPGSDMGYMVVKAGDRGVGGIMTIPADAAAMGARPAWLGYIHSGDVDATCEGIKKVGGKVHREPADIPGVGRFAVVADPGGAMFMLLNPSGQDQPPVSPMTPGHVAWHELYAADWKAAFAFYSELFGWTKGETMDMGPMGSYQLFSAGGGDIGGMMDKPPQVPAPYWGFYFFVSDIDAAANRVTGSGGSILMGPMEVPGGGWILQGMDPQGAVFALTGPRV